MRILIASALAALILVGTQLYLATNKTQTIERVEQVETEAAGAFSIELVPMFDAGPDEFALDAENSPSILVELRGQQIFERSQPVASGETVIVENVTGLIAGDNELYLKANSADGDADKVRGLRVRVLRDGLMMAEQWLSCEPGAPVEGPVRVMLSPTLNDEHNH
jgi:hypothetical protein